MEDQSQSRRTNILVGDEILTQIADSPYISHENGVMTINLSNQPNPATIGNITITALRDGKGDHLLVKGWNLDAEIATLQDIYDLAALKTDLTNYATKTDPAGVAVTWETLANKPTTFPPAAHTHKHQHTLDFFYPGELSAGDTRYNVLPASVNAQLNPRVKFKFATAILGNYSSIADTRVDLQYLCYGTWESIYSAPENSALVLPVGYSDIDYDSAAVPLTETYHGRDMFRTVIVAVGTGATDLLIRLEFEEV